MIYVYIIAGIFIALWLFTPVARSDEGGSIKQFEPPAEIEAKRLLSCVKAVENSPLTSPGGVYQFRRETWEQYSTEPYETASRFDRIAQMEVERVARAHLAWIKRTLKKHGQAATPFVIGQIWNAGYTNWETGRLTFSQVEFGKRILNCYEEGGR